MKSCRSEPWPRNLGSQFGLPTDLRRKGRLAGSVRWVQRLMSKRVQRFSNTQVGYEPFAKFYALLLFSAGYKSVDLIPFCLETIRSDRATITISLPSGRPARIVAAPADPEGSAMQRGQELATT